MRDMEAPQTLAMELGAVGLQNIGYNSYYVRKLDSDGIRGFTALGKSSVSDLAPAGPAWA